MPRTNRELSELNADEVDLEWMEVRPVRRLMLAVVETTARQPARPIVNSTAAMREYRWSEQSATSSTPREQRAPESLTLMRQARNS
jgi:hypothetical protein